MTFCRRCTSNWQLRHSPSATPFPAAYWCLLHSDPVTYGLFLLRINLKLKPSACSLAGLLRGARGDMKCTNILLPNPGTASVDVNTTALNVAPRQLAPGSCDEWVIDPSPTTNHRAGAFLYIEFWAADGAGNYYAADETITDLYVVAFPTEWVNGGCLGTGACSISTTSGGTPRISPPIETGTPSHTSSNSYWDWAAATYQRPYHRIFVPLAGPNDDKPLEDITCAPFQLLVTLSVTVINTL